PMSAVLPDAFGPEALPSAAPPPPSTEALRAADTSKFAAVDVIRAKRDGGRLSDEQIAWVVDAYTRGVVAEEQMSALAMAIFLRGMDSREIASWTGAMIDSGE